MPQNENAEFKWWNYSNLLVNDRTKGGKIGGKGKPQPEGLITGYELKAGIGFFWLSVSLRVGVLSNQWKNPHSAIRYNIQT